MNKKLWLLKLSFKLGGFYPTSLSSFLSVLSLSIGVSTLLVALCLVDSYEKSFKESIYSVFAHVSLYPNQTGKTLSLNEVRGDIESIYKKDFKLSEAVKKEGLLAHNGKVSGVLIEGINQKTVKSVVDYEGKLIGAHKSLEGPDKLSESPHVFIGKSLVERFSLKVGDEFMVVIPYQDFESQTGFSRKLYSFSVAGVLDLGSYDANKRFVVLDQKYAAKISEKPKGYFSEVKVRLSNEEDADSFKSNLMNRFAEKYWVRTWKDKSGGLLEAIKIERLVIFFLVFILVVVAAFNVSTNLYLNLSKRLKDFSVLQSLGLSQKENFYILVLNGLYLGAFGILFGYLLAQGIVFLLNYILVSGYFVPPDVYKLTSISLEITMFQFSVVSLASLALCCVAALIPALSSYKTSIVKGLRYQ